VQDAYNLGWKLAAVLAGAACRAARLLRGGTATNRTQMLGLATSLLEAAETRHYATRVARYINSNLAIRYIAGNGEPAADNGVLAGDRAPDAPSGRAGQPPVCRAVKGRTDLAGLRRAKDQSFASRPICTYKIRVHGESPTNVIYVHAMASRRRLDSRATDGYIGAIVSAMK